MPTVKQLAARFAQQDYIPPDSILPVSIFTEKGNGSLWFEGNYGMSYQTAVVRKVGEGRAEVTTRKYSVTTSKHVTAFVYALNQAGWHIKYVNF